MVLAGILIGVAAAITYTMTFPETAHIMPNPTFTVTIDGETWTEGKTLAWGLDLIPGDTVISTLAVTNTGSISITVTLTHPQPLPTGWIETWEKEGQTVTPGNTLTGLLTLTIPLSTPAGDYGWSTMITGTGV